MRTSDLVEVTDSSFLCTTCALPCWIWLFNISEHSVRLEQLVQAHVRAGLLVLTVYNVKLMHEVWVNKARPWQRYDQ